MPNFAVSLIGGLLLTGFMPVGSQPPSTLIEFFRNTKLGDVPKGWDRDDAVGVRFFRGFRCLDADMKGKHSVSTSLLRIEADFIVDVIFQMGFENSLHLTLKGKQGSPDLDLAIQPSKKQIWISSDEQGPASKVKLADVESAGVMWTWPARRYGLLPRLRLEREGDIFRVIANGEVLIARPLKEYGDFEGVKITLTGNLITDHRDDRTRVFAIGIGPRPETEKKR